MKVLLIIAAVFLSGCGLFHSRHVVVPQPPELIVTGAPAGSNLFVDGVAAGPASEGERPQVLSTTPGTHTLEVHTGVTVAYRENFDVAAGERRVITVLSGASQTDYVDGRQ